MIWDKATTGASRHKINHKCTSWCVTETLDVQSGLGPLRDVMSLLVPAAGHEVVGEVMAVGGQVRIQVH